MDTKKNTTIQVVQHLSPGGLEVMALDLKKFNQKHSRILIVSLEGNRSDAIKHWPRLEAMVDDLVFLNKKQGIDLKLFYRLASLFIREKATTIHTHHIGPLLYGGISSRLAGIRNLIHTEHDSWHLENKKRRILQRFILFITRPKLNADADMVATSMRKHLQKDNINVIKNGIDTNYFVPGNKSEARKHFRLPEGAIIIGSSGRLETVKGHNILIDALSHLHKNIHLVIAGRGSLRQALEQQAIDLRIQDRVHFLGQCDNMPTFYQSLDLFCLPSFMEGMPLAPLEAQSCGIPAVISDTGGAAETLCKITGILVAPGNSHALAQALRNLLLRKNRTQPITEKLSPRPFVEANGNAEHMAREYANLCNQQSTPIGASSSEPRT